MPGINFFTEAGLNGSRETLEQPVRQFEISDNTRTPRRSDAIAGWKFDRPLSVSHLLRALETFNSLGITFVSLSKQMDNYNADRGEDVHRLGCHP